MPQLDAAVRPQSLLEAERFNPSTGLAGVGGAGKLQAATSKANFRTFNEPGVSPAVLMSAVGTAPSVKVGDLIPDVSLDLGFPPEKVNIREFSKGKKIVLVGLPGAFTPT